MRIVVIRNKDNSISYLRMNENRDHYENKYDIITIVNKQWNPYYVRKIKKYFERE